MTHDQPDRIRRLAGLSGLAGALLFFAGDMLFYGYFGPGSSFAEGMRTTDPGFRPASVRGGLIGPIAACLCIVGFYHVYLNVHPSSKILGRVMLVCFSC